MSSGEKGIRRREEGETTSSQRKISAQGNQNSSKKNHMKAEDESPTQKRNCKNDNDDEAERMEDTGSKGGGRLKHCIVDGEKEEARSAAAKLTTNELPQQQRKLKAHCLTL